MIRIYFLLFKEQKHIKLMYGYFIVLIFCPTSALQILVYTISAQVGRLTTLPIECSISLPTKWYIATLVARRVQRNFFEGLTLRTSIGKKYDIAYVKA